VVLPQVSVVGVAAQLPLDQAEEHRRATESFPLTGTTRRSWDKYVVVAGSSVSLSHVCTSLGSELSMVP